MDKIAFAFKVGFKKSAESDVEDQAKERLKSMVDLESLKEYVPESVEKTVDPVIDKVKNIDEYREGDIAGIDYEFSGSPSSEGGLEDISFETSTQLGPGKLDTNLEKNIKNDEFKGEFSWGMKF